MSLAILRALLGAPRLNEVRYPRLGGARPAARVVKLSWWSVWYEWEDLAEWKALLPPERRPPPNRRSRIDFLYLYPYAQP